MSALYRYRVTFGAKWMQVSAVVDATNDQDAIRLAESKVSTDAPLHKLLPKVERIFTKYPPTTKMLVRVITRLSEMKADDRLIEQISRLAQKCSV